MTKPIPELNFLNWPIIEVREAYGRLLLPCLHDSVLAHEKVAAEVRKQNKELQNCKNSLEKLCEVVDVCKERIDSGEAYQKICDAQDRIKAAELLMIAAMDTMFHVVKASTTMAEKLLSILPQKQSFFRKQNTNRKQIGLLLEIFNEGVSIGYDKLLTLLMEQGIQIINPVCGERFSPQHHRAVERIKGGKAGTIARVVRVGYQRQCNEDIEVLRFTDVAIYY